MGEGDADGVAVVAELMRIVLPQSAADVATGLRKLDV
jgi:hypothetical protein